MDGRVGAAKAHGVVTTMSERRPIGPLHQLPRLIAEGGCGKVALTGIVGDWGSQTECHDDGREQHE